MTAALIMNDAGSRRLLPPGLWDGQNPMLTTD